MPGPETSSDYFPWETRWGTVTYIPKYLTKTKPSVPKTTPKPDTKPEQGELIHNNLDKDVAKDQRKNINRQALGLRHQNPDTLQQLAAADLGLRGAHRLLRTVKATRGKDFQILKTMSADEIASAAEQNGCIPDFKPGSVESDFFKRPLVEGSDSWTYMTSRSLEAQNVVGVELRTAQSSLPLKTADLTCLFRNQNGDIAVNSPLLTESWGIKLTAQQGGDILFRRQQPFGKLHGTLG